MTLMPSACALVQQCVEVGQGAEDRVDVAVVGDVVAGVGLRGRVERRQPDRVDAELGQGAQPGGDAGQVADAVAVGVGEGPRVHLVDHGRPAPVVGGMRFVVRTCVGDAAGGVRNGGVAAGSTAKSVIRSAAASRVRVSPMDIEDAFLWVMVGSWRIRSGRVRSGRVRSGQAGDGCRVWHTVQQPRRTRLVLDVLGCARLALIRPRGAASPESIRSNPDRTTVRGRRAFVNPVPASVGWPWRPVRCQRPLAA